MLLSQLQKGNRAEIVSINSEPTLRNRLNSLGVIRGEELLVRGFSLAKQTMEIYIENTSIALRISEADKIEIKEI
ncbi:MAG: ferrous iron transport protein A [Sulfurovum sp.]|nr:ferrous iron transport protein A [Sulfurovaceae bacterium]